MTGRIETPNPDEQPTERYRMHTDCTDRGLLIDTTNPDAWIRSTHTTTVEP